MDDKIKEITFFLEANRGKSLPNSLTNALIALVNKVDESKEAVTVLDDLRKSLRSAAFTSVSQGVNPMISTVQPTYEFDLRTCSYGISPFVDWLQKVMNQKN